MSVGEMSEETVRSPNPLRPGWFLLSATGGLRGSGQNRSHNTTTKVTQSE